MCMFKTGVCLKLQQQNINYNIYIIYTLYICIVLNRNKVLVYV